MSEANERREAEIADRARELFRQSVRQLDDPTRARLAEARAKAIDAARRRPVWWQRPEWLLTLGGVAAACLVVALIVQTRPTSVVPIEAEVLSDLDILLEDEELELFEELEFYTWLLEQPELLESASADDGSG